MKINNRMSNSSTGLTRNPLYVAPANRNSYTAKAKLVSAKGILEAGSYKMLNEYFTNISKSLDYDLTHDPEVLNNPYLDTNTSVKAGLIPRLKRKIFEEVSPLYTIRHGKPTPEIIERFKKPGFMQAKLPKIEDHKLLFSVRQLLLIQAIKMLYDPLYKRNNGTVPPKTPEAVQESLNAMKGEYDSHIAMTSKSAKAAVESAERDYAIAERKTGWARMAAVAFAGGFLTYARTNLATASKIKTALGSDYTAEFAAVSRYVTRVGAAIFSPEYEDYYKEIPIGAHLIYSFAAGPTQAFHHGVYIGNKTVIEILNYKDGTVQSFQTVTHINDFIKRAVSPENNSPILIRTYTNPFPAKEIVNRAVWTLGRYPGYNLANENCETVASWIVSNVYDQEHYCFSPKTVLSKAAGRRFNMENNASLDGGRLTRRNRRTH